MRAQRVLGVVVGLLALASPALGQQTPPRPGQVRAGPPRMESGLGYRAYVLFDRVNVAARDTFEEVAGTSTFTATGGGGEVRFWRGLFGRLAISKLETIEGTRGTAVQGTFVSNGIPLRVEITPIELSAGWRYILDRSRRAVVYGGAGLLRQKYRETADFADTGELVDVTDGGYVAFAGFEYGFGQWLMAGLEVQHRSVSITPSPDSIAGRLDEDNLGGNAIRFLVGIRK